MMNYNILSYLIYALITIYIIVWVGRQLHRNGRVFMLSLFGQQAQITDTTNNLLLVAYYLFNIGYAILQFSFWIDVSNIATMLSSIADKTGILILILAGLHYNNMFVIYILSKDKYQIHSR